MQKSLRLFTCSAPSCNAPVYLCGACDRGQIYCAACQPVRRREVRRASRQRHWTSLPGRRATARRVARHRGRMKNVTHTRRGEVGPSATVPVGPALFATTAATDEATETTDGKNLDDTQATGDLGAIAACARLLGWTRDPFDLLLRTRSRITAHS